MSHDLSSIWIREELRIQNSKKNNLDEAYNSLEDKTTEYARGIKKMSDIRKKIIVLLNEVNK